MPVQYDLFDSIRYHLESLDELLVALQAFLEDHDAEIIMEQDDPN
jgi:hypothetical protein